MGILYAILASIGQGFGYTIIKKSFEEFPSSVSFMFDMLFGLIIWIPYAFIQGINHVILPEVMIFAFISALLSEAFVFYILSKGELSISGTLFSIYPVFTIMFSRIINKEFLSTIVIVFIIFTILGVIVISLPDKIEKK